MHWTWWRDSNERKVLVPSEAKGSYDSFNDLPSQKEQKSLFSFLLRRRNKGVPQVESKDARIMTKEGMRTFSPANVLQRRKKFTSDVFTRMLELKWRWIFVSCFITYFGSWLFFAALWYAIVVSHGDLERVNDPTWVPCVNGIVGFTSIFLFSVETQHTIGYGQHYVTEKCATGVLLLCLQSIVGVILEGLVVGLVFLKISRAKKRSESLLFSRLAVVCHRDGRKYFMFRVADTRTSHLLEAHVRAQFIRKRVTAEGELVTHSQTEMKVGGDGEKEDKILLFWPTTIIHEIDKDSPLVEITPQDLYKENTSFEIVVTLEGVVETTGLMTQARSSFAPHEISWGSRFQEVVYTKSGSGHRIIDYSKFDEVISEEPFRPQCEN